MVVKIEKSKKEEYKDTLKMSNMQPFEYVILSKNEFAEPITGTSAHGEWFKFNVLVEEFKTADPATGMPAVETPNEVLGYFCSAKTLIKPLTELPLDVRVKITQESVEGKAYKVYKMELLDEVAEKVTNEATNPSVSADDKIKTLKAAGVSSDDVVSVVEPQFDMTPEMIKARYEVL
jgi:hypothetical protein